MNGPLVNTNFFILNKIKYFLLPIEIFQIKLKLFWIPFPVSYVNVELFKQCFSDLHFAVCSLLEILKWNPVVPIFCEVFEIKGCQIRWSHFQLKLFLSIQWSLNWLTESKINFNVWMNKCFPSNWCQQLCKTLVVHTGN